RVPAQGFLQGQGVYLEDDAIDFEGQGRTNAGHVLEMSLHAVKALDDLHFRADSKAKVLELHELLGLRIRYIESVARAEGVGIEGQPARGSDSRVELAQGAGCGVAWVG